MRNEEIERVMNYLARRSGDYSKIDFEKQLDSVRKTLREVTERNRQLSRLLKEGKKRGRLIDIRLALLRWRLNADD
ncbi:MAG TPA: hypothetical protein VK117_07295 [Pyrinomonadaceae bacterium]|nr:hypothetical protein [Pyrinomonadaceae bacterium]